MERQLEELINTMTSDMSYNKSIGCDVSLEEQTLSYLKELQGYKDGSILTQIRDKAISDFADRMIELSCDGEFMSRLNEFSATTILETAEEVKDKLRKDTEGRVMKLVDKEEIDNLPRYEFGVSLMNTEEYVKVSDLKKLGIC